MIVKTLILMIALSSRGPTLPAIPSAQIGVAPPPPDYPEGFRGTGKLRLNEVCVPAEDMQHIVARQVYLDQIYPRLCQTSIDHAVGSVLIGADLESKQKDREISRLKWSLLVGVLSAFLLGAAAGGGVAIAAKK